MLDDNVSEPFVDSRVRLLLLLLLLLGPESGRCALAAAAAAATSAAARAVLHIGISSVAMLFILTSSGIVALAMAWAIGAQDVSNALGTAVGSRAITVRQAIIIGAVCEFSGSLLGSSVATTISKGTHTHTHTHLHTCAYVNGIAGIVLPKLVANSMLYVEIMFCTLTGAFVWLAIATFLCLPVSTSHSLVRLLFAVWLLACMLTLLLRRRRQRRRSVRWSG